MSRDAQAAVDTLVRRFGLLPHPEGGFYSETYRAPARVLRDGATAGDGTRERRMLRDRVAQRLAPFGRRVVGHRARELPQGARVEPTPDVERKSAQFGNAEPEHAAPRDTLPAAGFACLRREMASRERRMP